MQAFLDKIKDYIKKITWENSKRYVGTLGLFIVMVVILVKCTGPSSSKDSTEGTEGTEVAKTVNGTESDVVSNFKFDDDFSQDSDDAITTLLTSYYEAYASGDTDTVATLAYPISDNEKSYIQLLANYYEKIDNISYYSKSGLADGSYFVSVSNEIKFKDIDTAAPNLDFFYVQTDSDGNLYIDNVYSYFNQNFGENLMDSDIAALMKKYMKQADFLQLRSDIDEKYTAALESDDSLNTMLSDTLQAAITDWLSGVTIVKAEEPEEVETETTVEEVTEAATETTEATETKDDSKTEDSDDSKEETKEDSTSDDSKTEDSDDSKEETKEDSTSDDSSSEETTSQVKTNNVVNVRDSASADGELLGKLTAGVVLTKLGEDGDWTIVKYSGGKDGKGYIRSDLLDPVK